MSNVRNKNVLVGGGFLSLLYAYMSYLQGFDGITTVYTKGDLKNTTSYNIAPSLTIDEILSVVPRGEDLERFLKILFNLPSGIWVDDVPAIGTSESGKNFIKEVTDCYKRLGESGLKDRQEILLQLGKLSMQLWQALFEHGDEEIKEIFRKSNFNPCREPENIQQNILHDGYRTDLIYNIKNAETRAKKMCDTYSHYGYNHCKVLSPDEAEKIDPSLKDFCASQSVKDNSGNRVWKNSASALWRPGGCIDTSEFVPLLYDYLERKMGTYVGKKGTIKNRFKLKTHRTVNGVIYDENQDNKIRGLAFVEQKNIKTNDHYTTTNYIFCPGENVGTLDRLGFEEPAYARFAGPSLKLSFNIPEDLKKKIANFNTYMEVHQLGVVLALQAKEKNGKVKISVAGMKAFYADVEPKIDEAFAINRHTLQLNIINDVYPELISIALGKDTKGKELTKEDLDKLAELNIATRWVGSRAVTADGYPNYGKVKKKNGVPVENGMLINGASSGGISFGPVLTAAAAFDELNLQKTPSVTKVFACLFTNTAKAVLDKSKEYANPSRKYSR